MAVVAIANSQVDFLLTDAAKPDSFTVAFYPGDSMIQVNANVNGRPEKFILDNGCPYLVINARHWQKEIEVDSSMKARGIGGTVTAGNVFIDSFNWRGLQKHHFKAIAADLPHMADSICGLIGFDVFKDYRVTFDFDKRLLSFMKPDTTASITDTSGSSDRIRISFTRSKHLPVFTTLIGSDTLRMAIDCAATQNVIYAKFIYSLKTITNVKNTLLKGAGAAPLFVLEGVIPEMVVNDVLYRDMKFVFDDNAMNQVNQSLPYKIDGLLGYPFLKQYKTAIDFPNQVIEIYTSE